MRIKDIPSENRPRERLLKDGVSALSSSELLAIILQKGTKKENVIDMCNRLISAYGLNKLSDLSLQELQEIEGIGPAKAMQIIALFELNKRCSLANNNVKSINSAKDVFKLLHERFKNEKQEMFIALYLDVRNHLLKEEIITKGVLDASIIHPREVFRGAIKEGAKSVIIAHNHPSGDSSPSNEDIVITERLIKAGEVINIKLLDHIIIGKDSFWSYSKNKE